MKYAKLLGLSIIAATTLSNNSYATDTFLGSSYKSGENKVNFLSEHTRVAGNIYLPPNYDKNKSYPAIIAITPASGVKEQTAGIYAAKMAKRGYIALAFDHRTYGESAGMPRGMENAPMKVEDIKSAISFIRTFDSVDPERIGLLGICSGAGYSLQAAMQDTRLDAVATVSGFIDFIDYAEGGATQYMTTLTGKPLEQYRQQIKIGSEARQKYFETGEVVYIDGIPSREKAKEMNAFWERAANYYRNPERGGSVATYTPMRAAMSLDTRYAFNPSEHMELLADTPYLAIIGTEALSAYFSKIAVTRGQEAKVDAQLFEIEGAKHFDLYDQNKYVNQAVIKLDSYFDEHLK